MAGAHIYEGIKTALESSETWGMGWYKNWTNFTSNKTQDWVASLTIYFKIKDFY